MHISEEKIIRQKNSWKKPKSRDNRVHVTILLRCVRTQQNFAISNYTQTHAPIYILTFIKKKKGRLCFIGTYERGVNGERNPTG